MMKSKYTLFTAMLLFVVGVYVTSNHKVTESKPFESVFVDSSIITPTTKIPTKKITIKRPKTHKGDLSAFMRKLGNSEGLGNYDIVSRTGYLGLYQFHPKTLRSLGFNVSSKEFLASPALQDSAMIAYMRMNAYELRSVIRKFNGTTVHGVYVTKAGILAGAHLVGSAGILAFFYPDRYDYRVVDGNGVHVSQYMTKFAGYDLRGL